MGENLRKLKPDVTLDLRGEPCPEPQIEIVKRLNHMREGQVLEVVTDDEPLQTTVPELCKSKGYPCEVIKEDNITFRIRILKK
ncbi:MAG: sulfurtransferase TusA family protein [Metallosphaera yellowstonensis]|jgi:Predicted redox protein, regulator of disulfide bond formation|uniref:Putative redox protein, regulator of disulfide bond formation n=1 Tax=Metallosphaera yellowstonensis MK1 TaxID=671065 RepID=H2C4D3_9CREN|nr:sulfurtransferase TusA family protein [Metallosphaera yellowstonensis]EHP69798.1 putative redox protein, regulator of disulfide bond formation [Metallosphaera yellowstonensis MK1]